MVRTIFVAYEERGQEEDAAKQEQRMFRFETASCTFL
jgi:hypothetical protein